MAQQAINRIQGHEELCAERWVQSRKASEASTRDIKALFNRWWAVSGGTILILLAVSGYFARVQLDQQQQIMTEQRQIISAIQSIQREDP